MRTRVLVTTVLLFSVSFAASAQARPNTDAFLDSAVTRPATTTQRRAIDAVSRPGTRVQYEERLGVPTVLWASDPKPTAQPPRAAARSHLADLAPAYGLRAQDVAAARVTGVHDTGGVVIVQYEQQVDGIPVLRDRLNVALNQGGGLIGATGYLPRAEGSTTFTIDTLEAVRRAEADDFPGVDPVDTGRSGDYETFTLGDTGTARAKRVMYQLTSGLVPAYYVEIDTGRQLTAYVSAAADGRMLSRTSLTADDAAFSYRVWADPADKRPLDGPQGDATSPHPTGTPTSCSS